MIKIKKVTTGERFGKQKHGRVFFFNTNETTAVSGLRKLLPKLKVNPAKATWSRYCGCGCGCSPGFTVKDLTTNIYVELK